MTYPRFSYYTLHAMSAVSVSSILLARTLLHTSSGRSIWKALLEPAHRGYSMHRTMTVDSARSQR